MNKKIEITQFKDGDIIYQKTKYGDFTIEINDSRFNEIDLIDYHLPIHQVSYKDTLLTVGDVDDTGSTIEKFKLTKKNNIKVKFDDTDYIKLKHLDISTFKQLCNTDASIENKYIFINYNITLLRLVIKKANKLGYNFEYQQWVDDIGEFIKFVDVNFKFNNLFLLFKNNKIEYDFKTTFFNNNTTEFVPSDLGIDQKEFNMSYIITTDNINTYIGSNYWFINNETLKYELRTVTSENVNVYSPNGKSFWDKDKMLKYRKEELLEHNLEGETPLSFESFKVDFYNNQTKLRDGQWIYNKLYEIGKTEIANYIDMVFQLHSLVNIPAKILNLIEETWDTLPYPTLVKCIDTRDNYTKNKLYEVEHSTGLVFNDNDNTLKHSCYNGNFTIATPMEYDLFTDGFNLYDDIYSTITNAHLGKIQSVECTHDGILLLNLEHNNIIYDDDITNIKPTSLFITEDDEKVYNNTKTWKINMSTPELSDELHNTWKTSDAGYVYFYTKQNVLNYIATSSANHKGVKIGDEVFIKSTQQYFGQVEQIKHTNKYECNTFIITTISALPLTEILSIEELAKEEGIEIGKEIEGHKVIKFTIVKGVPYFINQIGFGFEMIGFNKENKTPLLKFNIGDIIVDIETQKIHITIGKCKVIEINTDEKYYLIEQLSSKDKAYLPFKDESSFEKISYKFTTADGVDIYDNMVFYDTFSGEIQSCIVDSTDTFEEEKYETLFYHKKDAETYLSKIKIINIFKSIPRVTVESINAIENIISKY